MVRPYDLVRPTLLTTLALGFALTGACKSNSDESAASADGGEKTADTAKTGDDVQPTTDGTTPPLAGDDDPRAAALAITKATTASTVPAKGIKNLGFSLEKIIHLFALKATAKVPDWGAPGEGEAKLAQDDDLDTAWRCEFGGAQPCALGLALPESAKVEVLRIYVAAGPKFRDHKGHPRVAKLRVHTDAGYADVKVSDGANHAYVRFDAPIQTQSLALEVLDVHTGDKSKQVHIAEVEVYGTEGVPRSPLALDPQQAWVSWETTAWTDDAEPKIRQVFVYTGDGTAHRRLARATAVYGEAGDDYALFERLTGTNSSPRPSGPACGVTEGSYVLFDKRNRMYYPLNDLGGAGTMVFRHKAGRGFAAGWMNEAGQFTVKGIVDEGGKLTWKRPPKEGTQDGKALLTSWGFDPEPIQRGVPQGGAVAGCHQAGTGELEPVIAAAKLKDAFDAAQWMICSVGGDTLYATAPCDRKALAYQLDAAGKIVGKHESKKDDARGLRLRRVGDSLFVELSAEQGNTSTLMLSAPGSFTELERRGGLYVRPPSSCGTCTDEWQNPEVPIDEGIYDETGGDEVDGIDITDEQMLAEGDEGDEGDEGFEPEDEGEDELEEPEEPEPPAPPEHPSMPG
jgi:hypothetical protein